MAKRNIYNSFILTILFVFISSCNTKTKKSKMVVEITTYRAAKNVNHQEILSASKAFNEEYCSKCKGLISRQFLKTEDGYMDIFVWKSKEDVEQVQKTFMQDKNAMKFASLTDPNSLTMKNYEVLESSNFNN